MRMIINPIYFYFFLVVSFGNILQNWVYSVEHGCICRPDTPVCTTVGTSESECVARCTGKLILYPGRCI